MSNFSTTAQLSEIHIILRAAVFTERARNGLITRKESGRLSEREVTWGGEGSIRQGNVLFTGVGWTLRVEEGGGDRFSC